MSEEKTQEVSFDQLYPAGHTYTKRYESTNFLCPHCGKPEVWTEAHEGDYYQGPEYLCLNCAGVFFLPSGDGETAPVNTSPTRGPVHHIRELTGWEAPQ